VRDGTEAAKKGGSAGAHAAARGECEGGRAEGGAANEGGSEHGATAAGGAAGEGARARNQGSKAKNGGKEHKHRGGRRALEAETRAGGRRQRHEKAARAGPPAPVGGEREAWSAAEAQQARRGINGAAATTPGGGEGSNRGAPVRQGAVTATTSPGATEQRGELGARKPAGRNKTTSRTGTPISKTKRMERR